MKTFDKKIRISNFKKIEHALIKSNRFFRKKEKRNFKIETMSHHHKLKKNKNKNKNPKTVTCRLVNGVYGPTSQ